jgi:hypothetical protein
MRGDESQFPLSVVERPLVPSEGMILIQGDTVRVNLSAGAVGDPISLAPEVFYGIGPRLSLGLTHVTGICLTGAAGGCPSAYDDFGLESLLSLVALENLRLAVRGGLLVPRIKGTFSLGLKLGAMVRLKAGKIAIDFEPSLYVGMIGRSPDDFPPPSSTLPRDAPYPPGAGRVPGPRETLLAPIHLYYQVTPATAVFVSTGFFGPISNLGDYVAIPLGFGTVFAINQTVDLGAEFRFNNLFGKHADFDFREFVLRLALRL